MHKMSRTLILNQNYNSPRKVFQNAPDGIRACLDFQNFPREDVPGPPPPHGNGPPAHIKISPSVLAFGPPHLKISSFGPP